jgi:hypothetical protein
MTPLLIIGAVLGSLITWAITTYFYGKKRRHYLRDTTALMQRSMEIQDQFHATHAMLYVSALRALEAGDSESAKRDVASGAAGFYHQFSGSDQSEWIQAQKREVELLAKSSNLLRDTLEARKHELERQKA